MTTTSETERVKIQIQVAAYMVLVAALNVATNLPLWVITPVVCVGIIGYRYSVLKRREAKQKAEAQP